MPHNTQLEMGPFFLEFLTPLDWLQWQPIVAMPPAALSASQQATIRIGQQATQRGEGGGLGQSETITLSLSAENKSAEGESNQIFWDDYQVCFPLQPARKA